MGSLLLLSFRPCSETMARKPFNGSPFLSESSILPSTEDEHHEHEHQITIIRMKMANHLQKRLDRIQECQRTKDQCESSSSCSATSTTPDHHRQQQQHSSKRRTTKAAAQALEQLLYRSAYTIVEYQDESTLYDRIRTVITIQLCRRLQRRRTQTTSHNTPVTPADVGQDTSTNNDGIQMKSTTTPTTTPTTAVATTKTESTMILHQQHQRQQPFRRTNNRQEVLQRSLGDYHRYKTVRALVKEVRNIKIAKVASMKGCSRCCSGAGVGDSTSITTTPCLLFNNRNNNTDIADDSITAPSDYETERRLPQPIKDLFFHMPLVVAYEMTPMERLPYIEWESLIQDAQCKLQSYHEYYNNTTKNEINDC
jgi:hypothetical protein